MRQKHLALIDEPTVTTMATTTTVKTKTPPPNLLPEALARDLVSVHDLAPAEVLQLFNLTSMLSSRRTSTACSRASRW